MSNRGSSPLRQPVASAFVNELMCAGWSRKDADTLEVVQLSLRHAGDPYGVQAWARRAAVALSREPVLLGAIHRFGSHEGLDRAVWALHGEAPDTQRDGLAKLLVGARWSRRRD